MEFSGSAAKAVQRRVDTVKLAPLQLVVSIAFAAACGRTNLADALLDPDAVAGEGPSSRRGGAGNGTGGTVSTGGSGGNGAGVPRTGGGGGVSAGNGGAGQGGAAGSGGMIPVDCGDGIVAPGEACDPGSEPAVPALELRQGTWRMPVLPVVGSQQPASQSLPEPPPDPPGSFEPPQPETKSAAPAPMAAAARHSRHIETLSYGSRSVRSMR